MQKKKILKNTRKYGKNRNACVYFLFFNLLQRPYVNFTYNCNQRNTST